LVFEEGLKPTDKSECLHKMRVGNYRKVSQNPIEDGTSHDQESRKLDEANLELP
jgi:hypothetical protein